MQGSQFPIDLMSVEAYFIIDKHSPMPLVLVGLVLQVTIRFYMNYPLFLVVDKEICYQVLCHLLRRIHIFRSFRSRIILVFRFHIELRLVLGLFYQLDLNRRSVIIWLRFFLLGWHQWHILLVLFLLHCQLLALRSHRQERLYENWFLNLAIVLLAYHRKKRTFRQDWFMFKLGLWSIFKALVFITLQSFHHCWHCHLLLTIYF